MSEQNPHASSEIRDVALLPLTGAYAGNKEVASSLREKVIRPTLKQRRQVRIDFSGISGTTQSFVHSLISDVVRADQCNVELLRFKGCNDFVKDVVTLVMTYSQSDWLDVPGAPDTPSS